MILAIRYIPYRQIDRQKWDRCIQAATNGLLYACSLYLDAMASEWDALVEDDYVAVMPLCRRRKYGIDYLYQPSFTASLGVFGRHPDAAMLERFLERIPDRFRLWDIYLNYDNCSVPAHYPFQLRRNYVLTLQAAYEELAAGYREQTVRNIRKAIRGGYHVNRSTAAAEVIRLYRTQPRPGRKISDADLENFSLLCDRLNEKGMLQVRGAVDPAGRLVSGAIFFIGMGRAIYIMAANSPEGLQAGTSHLLLDDFIREYAANELLLDFEGSDAPGVAFFYSSFGAREENYPALRMNRLPPIVRWLKKLPAE